MFDVPDMNSLEIDTIKCFCTALMFVAIYALNRSVEMHRDAMTPEERERWDEANRSVSGDW